MQFVFSLIRIKGLYVFRALLAHPKEGQRKRQFVYYVRVMSVSCTRVKVEQISLDWYQSHFKSGAANWHNTHAIYQVPLLNRLLRLSRWCSKNVEVFLILNKLNKKCIALVSLYWYTVMHGQKNIKFTLDDQRLPETGQNRGIEKYSLLSKYGHTCHLMHCMGSFSSYSKYDFYCDNHVQQYVWVAKGIWKCEKQ
jgi:hypothetical protein